MKLVIVTGLSGSGKSVALHTLEDLDYYCIDNLPVALLMHLAEQIPGDWGRDKSHVAVGIDARSSAAELQKLPAVLARLKQNDVLHRIFFLYADETTLLQRFQLTRRKHPLTRDTTPLLEALRLEQELLKPLMQQADFLVDTSRTNVHQLRDLVRERLDPEQSKEMSIQFLSFGFKYGVPVDADLVFDVRCLPNPHWDTNLRHLTGTDKAVIDFLEQHQEVRLMRRQLIDFLSTWIPHYRKSSRTYLNVAIGCTGGQHRSVYLVNTLASHFSDRIGNIITRHREL